MNDIEAVVGDLSDRVADQTKAHERQLEQGVEIFQIGEAIVREDQVLQIGNGLIKSVADACDAVVVGQDRGEASQLREAFQVNDFVVREIDGFKMILRRPKAVRRTTRSKTVSSESRSASVVPVMHRGFQSLEC